MLAIILFFVGLAALQVLAIVARTIVVLIVLMMIVGSDIATIALVACMIITIFVATMLLVAQYMATCSRKTRCFCPWRSSREARHLVGCLTLLKESNELERVSRHHLVQVRKIELMHLGLHKEDLFTLLLHRGYFHHLTKVATLEIAEKLYSTPHELMHWHESGLLGCTKPANQLVACIGKTGDSHQVILDTFVKVCLFTICIVWTSLCDDADPFGQAYVLKALTYEVKQ